MYQDRVYNRQRKEPREQGNFKHLWEKAVTARGPKQALRAAEVFEKAVRLQHNARTRALAFLEAASNITKRSPLIRIQPRLEEAFSRIAKSLRDPVWYRDALMNVATHAHVAPESQLDQSLAKHFFEVVRGLPIEQQRTLLQPIVSQSGVITRGALFRLAQEEFYGSGYQGATAVSAVTKVAQTDIAQPILSQRVLTKAPGALHQPRA